MSLGYQILSLLQNTQDLFFLRTNDWSGINKQLAKWLIYQHTAFFQSLGLP